MRSWQPIFEKEYSKDYFKDLESVLNYQEYDGIKIYPNSDQIYKAFDLTPPSKVKVVILGQDPYHGPSQANGLAFSVDKGLPLPPSLKNIFKELVDDIGCSTPSSGDLTAWARQGVLLLNTSLTVEEGNPGAHLHLWRPFTGRIITELTKRQDPVIFILWGNYAHEVFEEFETKGSNTEIIASPHPSPLSAHKGFFGSRPFSTANRILEYYGIAPIDWSLK